MPFWVLQLKVPVSDQAEDGVHKDHAGIDVQNHEDSEESTKSHQIVQCMQVEAEERQQVGRKVGKDIAILRFGVRDAESWATIATMCKEHNCQASD
ncbi:MAG: hypothetical protein H6531_09280 [Actinobacteria bacterium]|nr:hypothetical protein [Actinomycetota bacterium]